MGFEKVIALKMEFDKEKFNAESYTSLIDAMWILAANCEKQRQDSMYDNDTESLIKSCESTLDAAGHVLASMCTYHYGEKFTWPFAKLCKERAGSDKSEVH